MHTLLTKRGRTGPTMLSRQSAEPIGETSSHELVWELWASFVSAGWANVDLPWPKKWNSCARADPHFGGKKRRRKSIWHPSPKSLYARKKDTTTQFIFTFLSVFTNNNNNKKFILWLSLYSSYFFFFLHWCFLPLFFTLSSYHAGFLPFWFNWVILGSHSLGYM